MASVLYLRYERRSLSEARSSYYKNKKREREEKTNQVVDNATY